jgi:hypothetical protein
MIEGIKRATKPGGLAIIEVPSAQSAGVLNDCHLYFYNPTILKELFKPFRNETMKFTPHLFMTFRRVT